MKNDNFLLSLSVSTAFHLLVIYFFLFGLPGFHKYKHEEQIIIFEAVAIDDITNIPTQNKINEKAKDIAPEEAKNVLNTTPPVKPAIEETKPKIEEKPKTVEPVENKKEAETIKQPVKKEEPPQKKPEKKEQEKKEEKKQPLKKEEIKKPQDKPKVVEKPKKNNDEDYLESLLKTLEKSSKGINNKSDKTLETKGDKQTTSKGSGSDTQKLSMSEIALIRKKIQDSWNIPAGARGAANIRVILYMAFEKDGKVSEVRVEKISCPDIEANICKAIADSAVRAVWGASPIENLRKDHYDLWKEVKLEFDPANILR